jgi:hypothetical protein
MLCRVLVFATFALALTLFLGSATAVAGEKTHEGKVVSVKGDKLTMETKGKEHTHDVLATAKISCDGKECKLGDLKAGVLIRVTTDDTNRAIRIVASTKGKLPD